jgi:hypothetical protein
VHSFSSALKGNCRVLRTKYLQDANELTYFSEIMSNKLVFAQFVLILKNFVKAIYKNNFSRICYCCYFTPMVLWSSFFSYNSNYLSLRSNNYQLILLLLHLELQTVLKVIPTLRSACILRISFVFVNALAVFSIEF